MSALGHHGEWLSLIEVSGPFLAEPVLKDAFPQGLEGLDPSKTKTVRQTYDEWREARDLDDPDFLKIHRAWIDLVLKQILELDEKGDGDVLKSVDELPATIRCEEHGVTLRPNYAVMDSKADSRPLLLIAIYDADVPLTEPLKGDSRAATPAERMVELCRATEVRLGLVTNGEQWMFVDAPVGAVTSFASWYARLWGQEPTTLQAFVNLLGIRRFFVDRSEQLPALLDNSLKFQDEVTDALGEQVRRAVEVLIQALDRADVDRNRELLKGVEPAELYEAGLTVMMRIVFLLSAEERGLLLLGDARYVANYAVSSLRMQLRSESEEILERRWDAWSRLLSVFRAVYGGIDHEALRLPALGGSLFDPDRFPFLEGRAKDSRWKIDLATPLPIDNRTVLYLLDAVQLFRGRTLSYLGLDVEQIGYVYEGLLERTVVRAKEVTLDLDATKNAKNPWVSLPELDDAASKGREAVEVLLIERTGSSASRVRNGLDKSVDQDSADKLLTACHADRSLRDRLRPYFHFLRTDRWGYPLVYPKGTFMVRIGADRRETGTHYTPKSFTEAIVKETLEPLVYVGPAEGKPREEWGLKTPAELLDLKICDPAMGSGAFLVQVCRWLSEILVEAWAQAEDEHKSITSEGEVVESIGAREPLRDDAEERRLTAKRLIAERCIYGVDMNPLAVELAKLSIWLITLAKGRPFGFLDHNLRCGDSLLGIESIEQLHYLEMKPGKGSSKKLFASKINQAIEHATALRSDLRRRPIRDIHDVEVMAELDEAARQAVNLPKLIADAFIGEVLAASGRDTDTTALSIEAGGAIEGDSVAVQALARRAHKNLRVDQSTGKPARRPFNWPLEFPEVFGRENGGFAAIVGNPPFLGGKLISGAFGSSYQKYLVAHLTLGQSSSVDLIVHFLIRVCSLVRHQGYAGLLARRSVNEAKNRDVGLRQLFDRGMTPYVVNTNIEWPGKASVVVHQLHLTRGDWSGPRLLNGVSVQTISPELDMVESRAPQKLSENLGRMFQGSILAGEGFKIDADTAQSLISTNEKYRHVLFPFIVGDTINKDPFCRPICWVICFWDWDEEDVRPFQQALSIADREVKPERLQQDENGDYKFDPPLRERWWVFLRPRSELYHALGRGRVFKRHPKNWVDSGNAPVRALGISTSTTKYPAFTYLRNDLIYSNTLCVLADDRPEIFAVLSSDMHAVWAWAQRTTRQNNMDSMRYAHGNIFETYPFPTGLLQAGDTELERLGKVFFESRQAFMEQNDAGLTKFYNDFHDAAKEDRALTELRCLQKEMNEAVCRRYGWTDLELACGFHQGAYLPDGKNTRFTISEEARLEVLRRLSRLNNARYEEDEKIHGQAARKSTVANFRDGDPSFFDDEASRTTRVEKRGS